MLRSLQFGATNEVCEVEAFLSTDPGITLGCTRRTALRAIAGGATALLVGGCAELSGAPIVRFWNGFTGPDGRAMLKLVDAFNDSTGQSVAMQRTAWGTYYSKLFVAGLGGRAPEMFVLQAEQMARFVRAGLVRPLDDLYDRNLPAEDFDKNVLGAATFGGVRYGMPIDVHPLGSMYNRTIVKRAGFDTLPTDGPAFMECLRAMSSLDDVYPYVFTWFRLNAFTALWQWGGDVLSADQSRCALDSPEALAAFEWCAGMSHAGLAPSPQNAGDSWVGFRQGRVGVTWSGLFMLADLQRVENLDYATAPVAQVGPQKATWAGSHILCMRHGLDGAALEIASEFARYLSANGNEWASGGQIPPRPSLRALPAFTDLEAQSAYADMLPYIRFMPQVPFVQEYLTAFDFAIEQTLRGQVKPKAALGEATRMIQTAIDRYRAAGWEPQEHMAGSGT